MHPCACPKSLVNSSCVTWLGMLVTCSEAPDIFNFIRGATLADASKVVERALPTARMQAGFGSAQWPPDGHAAQFRVRPG